MFYVESRCENVSHTIKVKSCHFGKGKHLVGKTVKSCEVAGMGLNFYIVKKKISLF